MQLSAASASSSARKALRSRSGSRLRKRHKRLDAICEKEYNRNHSESNERSGGRGSLDADVELRRSSRVRRAPVVLDVSPPPAKKRRKLGQNVKVGFDRSQNSKVGGVKAEEKKEDIEVSGSWRSRLRARVGNTTVMKLKEYERGSSSRRKKLFAKMEEDSHTVEESLEVESQRMMVVKSKRPGRVKAMNGLQGEKGVEMCDVESEEVGDANEEFRKDAVDVSASSSDNETGGRDKRNMIEVSDVEDDQKESPNIMLPVETCIDNDIAIEAENVEERVQNDELQQVECENEGRTPEDVMEAEISTEKGEEKADNEIRDVGSVVELDKSNEVADAKPAENENDAKAADSNQVHFDKVGRSRIRQGRRCGLCGVGSEGKPPKKLTLDNGDSENEAYSSSASEEPNYDKWDGFGDEPGWLGRLLGPINDRHGIPRIWVHQNCAVWSPEVYFAGLGHLKNIRAALCRGRALKCTRCGRTGATIGCRVDRCPRTYHLPCARACGCVFNHRKFLIACTDHKHKFQPAYRYLKLVKKMKARKMKLEMRKVSNDASRRDIEAEEKWLEHCGQDEEFLKRESKRLHRDLMRIAPVYIGGMHTDNGKTHDGWESVAGLQNVIQCMKEVVILPLLYPEFFSNLGLTPPRGVLLHGYPGTGKTLVVRALIGSCARGDKRIAYFARKGADCLGKYVGDAERQLRLLFQVAERCQPSIIFFDEIDGLAPRRTRQQDQTHSSVVSTLLTLLDGLKSRGSVVVIGATNRPDAVDPALRRPGRFDREIYFPLPSMEDRAAILSLHTKRWPKPVSGPVLQWVARKTAGYAGADLQALCTQAAVIALKRNFPLQEIMTAAQGPREDTERVPLPAIAVGERDWLEAISCSPPPCSRREAGVAANDLVACPLPTHLIPCLLRPLSSLLVSLALDQRLCIPPVISRAASLVETVIVSFLDNRRLSKDHWWTYVNDFLQESDILKEIERRLSLEGTIIQGPTFHPYDIFPDYISGESAKAEPSLRHGTGESESVIKNISYVSSKKIGFRMLVAGNPQSGQKHLASCLLNCFVGDIEVQKVDLATISQEGHGDMEQGMNQILMRCASMGKCVIYMPRIDLWAVESSSTMDELADKEDLLGLTRPMSPLQKCESTGSAEPRVDVLGASRSWSSFIEQVESICVSTSLIILATSEIPTLLLPHKIRQFFGPNVQGGGGKPSLHYTIPRFSVHVDGKFDHEMVVELSAIELSRDVLQPYVHIAHQRYHLQGNSETEMDQNCLSTRYHDVNQNVGNEVLVDSRSCDLSAKVLPTTTTAKPAFISRPVKGKSSLMLAISSFGYQILRYPHFAELCWVTSKLKEGPSMDISGAWSGWPFNSCIVRPLSLPNTEDIACDHSANLRSKDKYGLVRGLIAVGLLAYRGAYKSVREVSHEVRKVLELLVDRINSKVNAGKDRYQYVRVLSQVAYLEDMVNSWMHALQSLDQSASMAMVNPEPSTPGSADNRLCLANNPGQKGIEANCSEPAGQNVESIDVDRGNACKVHFSDGRIPFSDDGQKVGPFGDTASEPPLGCMDIDNESVNNANMQDKKSSDSCCTTNTAILDQDLSSKQANGFVSSGSLGLFSGSDGPVGVNVPRASEGCGKVNGFVAEMQTTCYGMPEPVELVTDATAFSKKASADPGIMCLYRCCSKCLHILHNLMRRIIIQQWTSNGNECTVEDVHDAVASLSVELLSTVNKFFIAGTSTGRFINDQKHEDLAAASCPELSGCHCRRSSLPAVCSCHSANGCSMEGTTISGSESGFNPVFIFRDGVLLPVECKEDVPFHCKFEKLCLCSLVESISMTKQPFD